MQSNKIENLNIARDLLNRAWHILAGDGHIDIARDVVSAYQQTLSAIEVMENSSQIKQKIAENQQRMFD